MTITIALAGKGGVGKTTTAGMIIKYLAQNQAGSIPVYNHVPGLKEPAEKIVMQLADE